MIWHETDLYTISVEETTDLGGTYHRPVIKWANRVERGPRMRRHVRAVMWAVKRICNQIGDAAVELMEKEGEEVLKW